jgi:hypothetical protein
VGDREKEGKKVFREAIRRLLIVTKEMTEPRLRLWQR